jgi:predicted ATPase
VDTQGDAFFVSFSRPQDALAAAAHAQRALAAQRWPHGAAVRVRIGIHTGTPTRTDEGYVGMDVHKAARVMAAGHGGQVLVSEETTRHVAPDGGLALADLGEHQLKDLTQPLRLYQLAGAGLESEFPALKTLSARPNNLPVQPAPLVGRERELTDLRRLLAESRLVTLTGPGGTGKTRLALELAAELLESFSSGVYLVPLAAVRDRAVVMPTIAETLKLREQPGETPDQTLAEYLREKELLLLLDNLEQVVSAAPGIAALLAAAPKLRVVATSREPLRLLGEQEYAVAPLPAPEAVQLFLDRARAAKPALVADEAVVEEVCLRLDRLPLAIELAAARVKLLSLPALLERLDDRLKLLTGGARDLDERQRTLRATIDWSYRLLSEDEQVLFRRLSVFAGGWTLEAAEGVAAPEGELDVLEGLASLVDKSLVRQEEAEAEPRFSMLETIREYAVERLEQSYDVSPTRRRHAAFFLGLAEAAAEQEGDEQLPLHLARLGTESDNLRAAFASSLGDAPELALRLAGALGQFWHYTGRVDEGRRAVERVLELDCAAQPMGRVRALRTAAIFADAQNDHGRAVEWIEEAIALARDTCDARSLAQVLLTAGTIWYDDGDLDTAAARYAEAQEHAGRAGDETVPPSATGGLGAIALARGDVEVAKARFEESRAGYQTIGDRHGEAVALLYLAYCGAREGKSAVRELHASLEAASELGWKQQVAACLELLADVGADDVTRGALLLGVASALREQIAVPADPIEREVVERAEARLRATVGDDRFEAAFAKGRRTAFEDAVAYALELTRPKGAGSRVTG